MGRFPSSKSTGKQPFLKKRGIKRFLTSRTPWVLGHGRRPAASVLAPRHPSAESENPTKIQFLTSAKISRPDSCSVWILAAKLPNSDLDFAVDFLVDFFLLFFRRKNRRKKSTEKSPAKFTWDFVRKNSPRISAEAFAWHRLKSGRNPLKSCVFRGTRRTLDRAEKVKSDQSPAKSVRPHLRMTPFAQRRNYALVLIYCVHSLLFGVFFQKLHCSYVAVISRNELGSCNGWIWPLFSGAHTYSYSQRDGRELGNMSVALHHCFEFIRIRVTAALRYSNCFELLRKRRVIKIASSVAAPTFLELML